MVKTNKPESPSAAAAKSKSSKSKSSTSPTAATTNTSAASSSSSSSTTSKAAAAPTTTTTSQIIDPTVSQLHRAWRQFISSFLVAARTQPTSDPNQAKILRDTIDTNLKARNELRRLLTELEEHLLGRSAKRKELLGEMLESTPCAIIPKKRKLEDSNDRDNNDNMEGLASGASAPHPQPTDVIDVDAGDLDSFPLM